MPHLDPQPGLVTSEAQSLAVEVVDGSGQLAHLFAGVDRDRHERRRRGAVSHGRDGLRQPLLGHVEGALADGPDRDEQRPEQGQDDDQRGEQGDGDERGIEDCGVAEDGSTLAEVGLEGDELGVQERGVARIAGLDDRPQSSNLGLVHGFLLQRAAAAAVLVEQLTDLRRVAHGLGLQSREGCSLGTDLTDGAQGGGAVVGVGEVELLARHGALSGDGVLQADDDLGGGRVVGEPEVGDCSRQQRGDVAGPVDDDIGEAALRLGVADCLTEG